MNTATATAAMTATTAPDTPDRNLGIGYVYLQLVRKGVTDLDALATAVHAKRLDLEADDNYAYDRLVRGGSASHGVVQEGDAAAGEKIIYGINHYLGLNRHPDVIAASAAALREYGTGCGTSAMSGGRSDLHLRLERTLADYLRKEAVMLFPTGYTANLGAISGLCQRGDVVLLDGEVHASIRDGMKLSRATAEYFRHNDLADLRAKLEARRGEAGSTFVVVESAYSMSGDLCPLRELVALKAEYGFYLYLDEAHSFGFYGAEGRGLADELGVLGEVDFFVSTFSKSTASIGGFLAMREHYRTFLKFRAGAYLFQAAIPPADVAAILAALEVIRTDPAIAADLHAKSRYFRAGLEAIGYDLGASATPIIPLYIPDVDRLDAFGKDLYAAGVFAVTVTYPAVGAEEGRVRLIVNAHHTYAQLDETIDILGRLGVRHGVLQAAAVAE